MKVQDCRLEAVGLKHRNTLLGLLPEWLSPQGPDAEMIQAWKDPASSPARFFRVTIADFWSIFRAF